MNNVFGVILAGGKGERFWPKSKERMPKQLLQIVSDKSMLQETVERLSSFISKDNIYVVSTESIKDSIKGLDILDEQRILAEPFGKNTALAIGYSAVKLKKLNPEATMLVCPADHNIFPAKDFQATIKTGLEFAKRGNLVTFGITPVRPDEGYGYIEMGEEIVENSVYKIKSFKEKPNIKIAKQYLKKGNTLWNSGIFLWRVKDILAGLEKYMPEMYMKLEEFSEHVGKESEGSALEKLYNECTSTSIDFGVMEQASNIVIVRARFSWDDVGDWNALERIRTKDKDGNITEGDVMQLNSKNNIIISDTGFIAAIGVDDLIIVKTDNEILICRKNETAEIKNLLKEIQKNDKLKKYL